jgi:hypothetical protein
VVGTSGKLSVAFDYRPGMHYYCTLRNSAEHQIQSMRMGHKADMYFGDLLVVETRTTGDCIASVADTERDCRKVDLVVRVARSDSNAGSPTSRRTECSVGAGWTC